MFYNEEPLHCLHLPTKSPENRFSWGSNEPFQSDDFLTSTSSDNKLDFNVSSASIGSLPKSEKDPAYVPGSESDSDSEQCDYTLKGDVATNHFLESCKNHMINGKFTASTKVLGNVAEELRSLHYLKVHVAECRIRWKSLGDKYRSEKKLSTASTWPYRYDMALLKGEPNCFGKVKTNIVRKVVVSSPLKKCKESKPTQKSKKGI